MQNKEERNTELISCENLYFSHITGQNLLENVSFSINAGENVCLIGPNGSGKSTIAHLILGLFKPQAGSISVLDRSPAESRLHVAYVPQHIHFDPLFPVTAIDVVLMGRRGGYFGHLTKHDKEEAMRALHEVGMEQYADTSFTHLSGGECQRILIARALADSDWRILIMDEPSAHVDTEFQTVLENLLSNCPSNKAVLCISHDMDFVATQFERILCLYKNIEEHSLDDETKTFHLLHNNVKKVLHHHHDGAPT